MIHTTHIIPQPFTVVTYSTNVYQQLPGLLKEGFLLAKVLPVKSAAGTSDAAASTSRPMAGTIQFTVGTVGAKVRTAAFTTSTSMATGSTSRPTVCTSGSPAGTVHVKQAEWDL